MSDVKRSDNIIKFNLMRCSTNFATPTENFTKTDRKIISHAQFLVDYFFQYKATLNHVLAQRYNNQTVNGKDRKAKIKQHSDKTEDMTSTGVIAFVTFYDKKGSDVKDYQILKFKLKEDVKENLPLSYEVVLYPGSIYIIPLSINRNYTHEIVTSHNNINNIPTRIGYVIRCSRVEAQYDLEKKEVYVDGYKLTDESEEHRELMKKQYFQENE